MADRSRHLELQPTVGKLVPREFPIVLSDLPLQRGASLHLAWPPFHEGRHWVVEHAYPSSLLGWLVIALRRHAEALHELSRVEGEELGVLQWAVSKALAAETSCLKEYSVFFAEAPGWRASAEITRLLRPTAVPQERAVSDE